MVMSKELWREHDAIQGLTRTIINTFAKGFFSGIGVYAFFRSIVTLIKNPFCDGIPFVIKNVLSKDCLQFSLFLGLYPSVYKAVVIILQNIRGRKDGWNAGIAGGLAGLASLVEDPSRRRTLALFVFARAVGSLLSTLARRKIIPTVPHFPVIVFSICAGFLVHCITLNRELIQAGYLKSLLQWTRNYNVNVLDKLFVTKGDKFISCQEVGLHKESCTHYAIRDFIMSLPAFAKLYFPIHLVPVLIFKRKMFLKSPLSVIRSLLQNVLMSSTFLATMVFLAKYTVCVLRYFHHKPPPLPDHIPIISGVVCALSLFFERANRRKELTMFMVPHTLYSVYQKFKPINFVDAIPCGTVVLFSISMASIMHAYVREPESLSLLMSGVLKYLL